MPDFCDGLGALGLIGGLGGGACGVFVVLLPGFEDGFERVVVFLSVLPGKLGKLFGDERLTEPVCCMRWNGGVWLRFARSIFACGTTGVDPVPVPVPFPPPPDFGGQYSRYLQ